MPLRTRRATPIGLDVGERWVCAAQLIRARAGRAPALRVARLARPVPVRAAAGESGEADWLDDAGAEHILDALARQGFEGENVVVVTPQKDLLAGVLDVPPRTSGAPLDLIIRNELARAHRLEPDEIESAWWELPPQGIGAGAGGGGGGGRDAAAQVIAVGCRHTDAEHMVLSVGRAGYEVVAIDARGPALARALHPALAPTPALTAVLEWGWETALILVIRAGVIVYERSLPEAGAAALHAELARKLSVEPDIVDHVVQRLGLGDPSEELAEDPELVAQTHRLIGERLDSLGLEVRASASYASRRFGGAVGRVLVCGEAAGIPGALERLSRKIDLETRLIAPVDLEPGWSVDVDEAAALAIGPPAGLIAAIGLAQHPVTDMEAAA